MSVILTEVILIACEGGKKGDAVSVGRLLVVKRNWNDGVEREVAGEFVEQLLASSLEP